MIIDCVSDLHGFYPQMEGGDLLIVAGDLTRSDKFGEYLHFFDWISKTPYRKRVVVAGNHDILAESNPDLLKISCEFDYLQDSVTEFEGLKIWGSPWTLAFDGINPKCKAFTKDTDSKLKRRWARIPDDIDILVTHSPPKGIRDVNLERIHCGSESLFHKARSLVNLKLFVWGHIHESYGHISTQALSDHAKMISMLGQPTCKSLPHLVNCSHVDDRYSPVNKPIRIVF